MNLVHDVHGKVGPVPSMFTPFTLRRVRRPKLPLRQVRLAVNLTVPGAAPRGARLSQFLGGTPTFSGVI